MIGPQFSLRTLLIAVGCLALAFGFFRGAITLQNHFDWRGVVSVWLFLGSLVFFGAGVGVFFERHAVGASVTAMVVVYVALALGIIVFAVLS